MAADKTIEIKINTNVDTTQSVKNITDLKSAISKLEEESNKLDFGSEAFEKSKEQIDELKKKLESLSKSQSKLDEELNAKAAEHAAKRAERMEKIGNNLAKFAAGVTDAFAGAFIAFGAGEKDAKKFNETLQKGVGVAVGVKGAIEAVVSGVQLAGPAFEAFNAVIKANPIAAVVTAVAALTAGIYLLVKAINAEESESEKLTKQLEKQKVAAEQLSKARQSEITVIEAKVELMKAQGKSDAEVLQATNELYEAKKKALQQDLVQLELQANITKAKLAEVLSNETLTESYFKLAAAAARLAGDEKQARILDAAAAAEKKKNSKEVTDQLLKDLTAVKELKDKIAILDIKQNTEAATVATKAAEAKVKAAEAKVKAAEEKRKEKEEEFKRERERIEQEYKDGDDVAEYLGALEKQKAAEKQYWLDYEQEQIDKANADKLNASLELYQKQKAAKEKYEQELYDGIIKFGGILSENFSKMDTAFGDLAAGITTNLTEAFKVIADKSSTTLEKVTAGLTAINGMLSAVNQYQNQVAEENVKKNQEALDTQLTALSDARDTELAKEGLTQDEKVKIQEKYAQQEYELKLAAYNADTAIKKKAFEQDKKMKIAQTVISTITGAMSALTGMIQAIPGPVGIILGALSAAAVVATGAIQIAAINKQKFDAGTPPSPPKISKPSVAGLGEGGGGAMDAPSLKKIGRTEKEIAKEAGGNAKRTAGGNEPVRAYVVSQDVTTAQDKQAVIDRRSSF